MILPLYNILLHLLLPLLPLVLLWGRLRGRRVGRDLTVRLSGWWRPTPLPRGGILVHAASAGETRAVDGLIRALRARRPEVPLTVTSGTAVGHQLAVKLGAADSCAMLPLDYPWMVGPFIESVRPRLLLVAESEIWPNLLLWCDRYGIPVIYVNGRFSPKKAWLYSRLSAAYRQVLRGVDRFLMQTEGDAERLRTMGVPDGRIQIVGDLKADQISGLSKMQSEAAVRRELGIGTDPLIVAGSTHPGEEEMLIAALRQLKPRWPTLRLLIAPRHLDRVPRLVPLLEGSGLRWWRRSAGGPATDADLLLLDTFGELAQMYAASTLSFVGGTLVPIGGHSVYEPAVFGKPVLIGRHDHECRAEGEWLEREGGLIRLGQPAELAPVLESLLADPAGRERMGQAARRAVEGLTGALERTLGVIDSYL